MSDIHLSTTQPKRHVQKFITIKLDDMKEINMTALAFSRPYSAAWIR